MLYMKVCKTDGLPCLNMDFFCGNCFLLQTFCHGLALAQQAVIEIQILAWCFEYIYLSEKELEQNHSRNGKAEQRPEFLNECWMLYIEPWEGKA